MIAKGLHFPNVTLVGIINADLALHLPDFRAGERTFQLLTQVAGRAGRGAKPGHVYLQTHEPTAPVMEALVSGDTESFYEAETEARRFANAPPFGRFAAIIVASESLGDAQEVARRIAQSAPEVEGMNVYGPAPAPLAMLRGRHRQRLLVHARRALDVQDVLRDWLLHIPAAALVIWIVIAAGYPLWAYFLAAYGGLALLKIRTFAEHRAHEDVQARTAVIEDRGFFAFLFLNNNFHVVHHCMPNVPWYDLPRLYQDRKEQFRRRNGAYVYRSYAEIFRQYLWRAKEQVPHPIWPVRRSDAD